MFGFFRKRNRLADVLRMATESEPESPDDLAMIQACRERFGPPPRSLTGADFHAMRLTLSPNVKWLFETTYAPLLKVVRDQPRLRARGQIVGGSLVQANQALFDPANEEPLPANVLY